MQHSRAGGTPQSQNAGSQSRYACRLAELRQMLKMYCGIDPKTEGLCSSCSFAGQPRQSVDLFLQKTTVRAGTCPSAGRDVCTQLTIFNNGFWTCVRIASSHSSNQGVRGRQGRRPDMRGEKRKARQSHRTNSRPMKWSCDPATEAHVSWA